MSTGKRLTGWTWWEGESSAFDEFVLYAGDRFVFKVRADGVTYYGTLRRQGEGPMHFEGVFSFAGGGTMHEGHAICDLIEHDGELRIVNGRWFQPDTGKWHSWHASLELDG